MNFDEVTISDKNLFDRYLKQYKPQASELTFTNMFMWRNYYKLGFCEVNGFLCIVSVPGSGQPFCFIPVGDRDNTDFQGTVSKLKEYFTQKGWQLKFKRVTEDELEFLKNGNIPLGEIVKDSDNSDYIYNAENLIKLSGKKYDGKRNHINRFKKEHEYEYTVLTEELLDECKNITHNWCKERNCEEHRKFYCEKIANYELLNNYKILGCQGALIKVDGVYKAFTVGEMLNEDTAVIHIEKADSSVNGLYTVINQQFCEHEWSGTTFINREQDLGVEGLRKAKLSYNPAKMIYKYTVSVI
ncbi:MAG: phosphatidylglycerol lysyltransferase domain-containing protein [Bacillota bacterium]|nr:phosphatidylglycerol lysyltransferase domain-containing protein [Bacillota bacterium]